jgi:hypothetical protein
MPTYSRPLFMVWSQQSFTYWFTAPILFKLSSWHSTVALFGITVMDRIITATSLIHTLLLPSNPMNSKSLTALDAQCWVLKATELCTLNGWIVWYVKYSLIKLFKNNSCSHQHSDYCPLYTILCVLIHVLREVWFWITNWVIGRVRVGGPSCSV